MFILVFCNLLHYNFYIFRLIKEQERNERQEALRKEKEQRNLQLVEVKFHVSLKFLHGYSL